MIPADQSSVPNKKDLNHRFIACPGQTDDISVLHLRTCHFLFFRNLPDTSNQIPVFYRLLIGHSLGNLHHFFRQHLNHRLIIPAQELKDLMNLLLIILLGNIPLTGRIALADMIIQTRPSNADILRQVPMTRPYFIDFPEKFNRILHSACTCIGSKIFGFILFH